MGRTATLQIPSYAFCTTPLAGAFFLSKPAAIFAHKARLSIYPACGDDTIIYTLHAKKTRDPMAGSNKMLSFIKSRKSTRFFGKKPVDGGSIRKILEAGRWAPSPLNAQPWHFIVVEDKAAIDALMKTPYYGLPHNSPPLIVAIVIEGKHWKAGFETGAEPGALGMMECYMSAAMASLNMTYAAQALGVDSCIISPYPNQAEPTLGLRARDFVPIFMCFGYGGKGPDEPPRERKDAKYVVSYGVYGGTGKRKA